MNIKKLFVNNRLLVRLIISYLITSVILTGILMIVVSSFVSARIKDQTTESATELLRQSYSTAYYALTDIYGDYYDLWSKDELILTALNSTVISEEDKKIISDHLDRETFRNDLIDSIYLINKKSNVVTSNVTTYNIDNFYDKGAISLFNDFEKYYNSYKDEIFFPRSIFTDDSQDNILDKNLISIVYSTKDLNEKLTSSIIVNIDQDKLSRLVNADNKSSSMIIVNGSGKVISDPNGSFGFSLPRDEFYMTIANNPNTVDSFIGDYLGEKSFITFKKAEDLGFVFISITSYSLLEKEVLKTNSYMALFFLIAMLISLLVSFFSTKRIYSPLNDLIQNMKNNPSIATSNSLDEYTFLGETYNSLVLKDKASHVARIFNGGFSDTSLGILGYTKENKFITLAIIPDIISDITRKALENIETIISLNTNWSSTITSNNCVSCILNDNEFSPDKIESIMEGLINLQNVISDELSITVSIGLGSMVNSLDSIKFSHRYAMLAVQNAMNNGDNQVVYYNDIENSKVAASQNKDSIADKIKDYIDTNFTNQSFSVEEISEDVDLSLGYIRQIFKNEKGLTLNDYIMNCRIELAKTLLLTTAKTAKDIAEEVGYYDNRYFYTLFKKKVGMTTDEYRKSAKEEILSEDK